MMLVLYFNIHWSRSVKLVDNLYMKHSMDIDKDTINVVIICYDALAYTKATIDSLFESTNVPYVLTVINNASSDGTEKYLKQLNVPTRLCKEYTLINNKENMGVVYAYNQGFKVSCKKGLEYTCFCNNDLYFQSGWLERMKKCMDDNPNIALLNPLRPSERTKFNSTISTMKMLKGIISTNNWRQELEEYSGFNCFDFDKFCNKIISNNPFPGNVEILRFPDSLSTCICLARNSIVSRIGHFADPIFPKYGGEDIDLCWSIMKLGFDVAILHTVYVHHFRGKSIKRHNVNRQEVLKASNKILLDKWQVDILKFLLKQQTDGVDIYKKLRQNTGNNYWLLSELNESTRFLER